MKRVFVPTRSGADWQRLLAKPEIHWKMGASAMTAAASWEAAAGALPTEITALFDATDEPGLKYLHLLAAFPEWSVELPGGATTSQTDILAVCRNDVGLCIIAVEAKVLEDFGPFVASKRTPSASAGQRQRLQYLHDLLGVEHFDDRIRYQLLHRTASSLLTARAFHADTAVMMVHAFDTPADRREDFLRFAEAMGGVMVVPQVYRVPRQETPALYLAWCDGDPAFRFKSLPWERAGPVED
jgi:hypothetical protein